MYQFFFLNSSNGGGVIARYGKLPLPHHRLFELKIDFRLSYWIAFDIYWEKHHIH